MIVEPMITGRTCSIDEIIGFFTFVILYEFGKDTESHLNTDYDTNAIHPPYVGNGDR